MSNKYGNKKTPVDGIYFDSRHESQRYQELKLLERGRYIKDLVLQPEFVLQEGFTHEKKQHQPIKYRADFAYTDIKTGDRIVEDAKGYRTKEYILKMKMLLKRYPEIRFREV